MTWIDNNGEVRPQSWEEYCEIESQARQLPLWMTTVGLTRPHPRPIRETSQHVSGAPLSKRSKRARLHARNPLCLWCGRVTILEVVKPIREADAATVDHLYSKLHPKRSLFWRRCVLACYECNMNRSYCETAKTTFVPKLPSRAGIARETCATLARALQVK